MAYCGLLGVRMIRRIVFLSLVFGVATAHAASDSRVDLESIAAKFQTTMIECPGKIWPGYSWAGLQVVLVRRTQETSLLWSANDGSLRPVPNSTLPTKSLSTSFSFVKFNGAMTMTLNTEETDADADRIFRLGVHEFFHQVAQKEWKKPAGIRGTTYPQSYQPRIFRRMLFDRLAEYLESDGKDSEALGRAAFWFKRWRTEFPLEAFGSADQYEGTARYADQMADLVARNGCKATEHEMLSAFKSGYRARMGKSVSGQVFDLSFEGYDIGGMSSLILRLIENDPSWSEAIGSGATPVEYLLKNVSPVEDAIPGDLEATFRATAERMNAEIGALVDSDLANYVSPDYVRIAIPQAWLQVNLGPKYFVISDKLPGAMILPMARDLDFENQTSVVNSKTNKVFFIDPANPCGATLVALVHKKDVRADGSMTVVGAPLISGRFQSEGMVDKKDLPWICGR